MKNTTKKIYSVLSAAAIILSASTAIAEESDIMLISHEHESPIYVDGTLLEKGAKTVGEVEFLPLRAICEALGFTVDWNKDSRKIEISNLPMYITCSPDRDGYTFAKTAPMLLGSAPALIDDVTYVPQNFVDEIIGYSLSNDNGTYYITSAQEETDEITAVVADLIYDENGKLTQIVTGDKNDPMNQLIYNLSDEAAQSAADLKLAVGMSFKGTAAALQTMSIPPQQPLNTIDSVFEATTDDIKTVGVDAVVVELVYDEDEKLIQIVTGDKEDPKKQVAFNLSEELAQKAIELGLEAGKTIVGEADSAQTKSLPPQQALVSISEVK